MKKRNLRIEVVYSGPRWTWEVGKLRYKPFFRVKKSDYLFISMGRLHIARKLF